MLDRAIYILDTIQDEPLNRLDMLLNRIHPTSHLALTVTPILHLFLVISVHILKLLVSMQSVLYNSKKVDPSSFVNVRAVLKTV